MLYSLERLTNKYNHQGIKKKTLNTMTINMLSNMTEISDYNLIFSWALKFHRSLHNPHDNTQAGCRSLLCFNPQMPKGPHRLKVTLYLHYPDHTSTSFLPHPVVRSPVRERLTAGRPTAERRTGILEKPVPCTSRVFVKLYIHICSVPQYDVCTALIIEAI